MNTENVISLQAVSADLLPYRAVKVTASGVDYAGAADKAIGITLPNDLNRDQVTVQLSAVFTEVVMGNGTDIVRGDTLEQAANGQYVKRTTGTIVGVAWTAGTEIGDRIEAFLYRTA